MGVVIRTASSDREEANAEVAAQVDEAKALGEVNTSAGAISAKCTSVLAEARDPDTATTWLERREIECRQARPDREVGHLGPQPLHNLAEEEGAPLECGAIGAGTVSGCQQLVQQVAVAMLDVDEVEPCLPRPASRHRHRP